MLWGLQESSVHWCGSSASCLSVHWNSHQVSWSSSAGRALGSPGSRASSCSASCLYCGVREGPEWGAGEGGLARLQDLLKSLGNCSLRQSSGTSVISSWQWCLWPLVWLLLWGSTVRQSLLCSLQVRGSGCRSTDLPFLCTLLQGVDPSSWNLFGRALQLIFLASLQFLSVLS